MLLIASFTDKLSMQMLNTPPLLLNALEMNQIESQARDLIKCCSAFHRVSSLCRLKNVISVQRRLSTSLKAKQGFLSGLLAPTKRAFAHRRLAWI
jgi:hypothetical protein